MITHCVSCLYVSKGLVFSHSYGNTSKGNHIQRHVRSDQTDWKGRKGKGWGGIEIEENASPWQRRGLASQWRTDPIENDLMDSCAGRKRTTWPISGFELVSNHPARQALSPLAARTFSIDYTINYKLNQFFFASPLAETCLSTIFGARLVRRWQDGAALDVSVSESCSQIDRLGCGLFPHTGHRQSLLHDQRRGTFLRQTNGGPIRFRLRTDRIQTLLV